MNIRQVSALTLTGLLCAPCALAGDPAAMIAQAESAGPASVSANATIKTPDGTTLREGDNGYTCYPQQDAIGPMCNPPEWDRLIGAMMAKQDYQPVEMAISYMLAGEGTALGVSNSDPYHPDPASAHDHVKEGPHLMIIVPDRSLLEGMSDDPSEPVYVMWGDTPYAHIMVKISDH